MKTRLYLILSIIILLVGIIGSLLFHVPVKTYSFKFPDKDGKTGYARVYLPKKPARDGKYPVVYLCPGIITPHTRMDYIAGELCRRGYAACSVFIPLWKPRRNLETLRQAIKYVKKNFNEIDHNKAAAMGHSLGGTTAVDVVLQDDSFYACSSIGFYIGGELTVQPKNILLGTGLHDDLNDPCKMRKSIASLTQGKVTKEGILTGNFRDKSAKYLFISPFSAHHSEAIDFYSTQQLLNWLHLSFYGTPEKNLDINFVYYILFNQVLMAGLILCLVPLFMFLSARLKRKAQWIIFFTLLISLVLLVLAPLPPVPFARAFGFVFIAAVISNFYIKRHKDEFEKAYLDFIIFVRISVFSILLFYFSLIICQFIFSLGILSGNKEYLLAFPGYILVSFQLAPCNFAVSVIKFLKQVIPWIYLPLLIPFLALFIYEMKAPGRFGGLINRVYHRISAFCKFDKTSKTGKKQKIILVILVFLVIVSWFYTWHSGLLKPIIMKQYTVFIFRYIAGPLILFSLFNFLFSLIGKKYPCIRWNS